MSESSTDESTNSSSATAFIHMEDKRLLVWLNVSPD